MKKYIVLGTAICLLFTYMPTDIYGADNTKAVEVVALSEHFAYFENSSNFANAPPIKDLISDSKVYDDGVFKGTIYIDKTQMLTYNTTNRNDYHGVHTYRSLNDVWENGIPYANAPEWGTTLITPIYYKGIVERITDKTPPILNVRQNISVATNGNVVITATATDTEKLHDTPYNMGNGWGKVNTLTVAQNGSYIISARDHKDNITTKEVIIENIDKIPPAFFASSMSVAANNKILIAVIATDNGKEQLSYSFDNEVTWQTSNMYEAEKDKEITIKVKDSAKNIASAKYTPILSGGGNDVGGGTINVPITIFDNAQLDGATYGINGVSKNGVYKKYAQLVHMPEAVTANKKTGIAIKISAASVNSERYLSGYARLNNKDYPIEWGKFGGEAVTPAGDVTGYIYIDKSQFTTNLKNAKLKVVVGEYLDAGAKTKVAEGSEIMYVSVDISPPTISTSYKKATGVVSINAFDSISEVGDILYSVDGATYKKYIAPFNVLPTNKSISITAVDKMENSGSEKLALGTDTEASDTTDNKIYTYKTGNAVVYIVGGNRSNTKTLNLTDFKVA